MGEDGRDLLVLLRRTKNVSAYLPMMMMKKRRTRRKTLAALEMTSGTNAMMQAKDPLIHGNNLEDEFRCHRPLQHPQVPPKRRKVEPVG